MFIYNVTVKVNWSIHPEWLQWMKEKHIPQIMASNCFETYQIVRLHEIDEQEGPTYAFQYYARSKALYNQYIELYAPGLREESANKWKDQCIAFRSLMEVVN